MFCNICEKSRQKNGFTRGCRNFQRSALDEHSKSLSHKSALNTVESQQPLCVKPTSELGSDSLNAQIRTVLYSRVPNNSPGLNNSPGCHFV
jgi:hypothetical protein